MSFELSRISQGGTTKVNIPYSSQGKSLSPPFALTPQHPEGGLAPTAKLAYDFSYIYLEVDVDGPLEGEAERSWRYGDGLQATFSHISEPSTTLFTTLGLAGSSHKPEIVIANSCGRWFPPFDCSKVTLSIDSGKGQSTYRATIPWETIPPLDPLSTNQLALNITFVSKKKGESSYYQLVADLQCDTESAATRNVVAAALEPPSDNDLYCSSSVQSVCCSDNQPLEIALGLFAPRDVNLAFEATVFSEGTALESSRYDFEAPAGRHGWLLRWSAPQQQPTGNYEIEIRWLPPASSCQQHHFVILNHQELAANKQQLEQMESSAPGELLDGIQTALFQLDSFGRQQQLLPPWEPPSVDTWRQVQGLASKLACNINPLHPAPGLTRRAFRSPVDKELYPYSIYFPATFSVDTTWPLLMMLHGSGVDERNFAANENTQQMADSLGVVLLFPTPKNKSGFYVGRCEEIILEALATAKNRFPLDGGQVYIAGFSMGGFGAWHTGLRNPEMFKAIAVISGIPSMPFFGHEIIPGYSFSPLDYIPAAMSMPLLVLHGSEDRAVPIEPTRQIAKQLEKQQASITYKEFPGAGHGKYDWPGQLENWLKNIMA